MDEAGNRGDDLRWEIVMFVVLLSKDYKLLLGMDYLANRAGQIDSTNCKLTLEKEGIRFALPLMEKRYVYKSAALKEYTKKEATQEAGLIEIYEIIQIGELERL